MDGWMDGRLFLVVPLSEYCKQLTAHYLVQQCCNVWKRIPENNSGKRTMPKPGHKHGNLIVFQYQNTRILTRTGGRTDTVIRLGCQLGSQPNSQPRIQPPTIEAGHARAEEETK